MERAGGNRTIVTIENGDPGVATRVRGLLDDVELVHMAVRGPRVDPSKIAGTALVIVVVESETDWMALADLARTCDTVVLSHQESRGQARRALAHGAIGCLPLTLNDEVLRKALLAVLAGEAGYSRAVLGDWLRGSNHHVRSSSARLTSRQRQILQRIAHGDTDKEIAERLGIAVATAHKHVQNLLRRLGVPNRAAAVTHANRLIVAPTDAPKDDDAQCGAEISRRRPGRSRSRRD